MAEWTAVFIYFFLTTTTVAGRSDVRSSVLFSIHGCEPTPGNESYETKQDEAICERQMR